MNLLKIVLLLAWSISFVDAYADSQGAPVATVAPVTTAAPTSSPVVQSPLNEAEKKSLQSEFKKALLTEKSSLLHQEKSSIRELTASQNMRLKKWREEQKRARKKFFDEHMSGPERREYVQKYLKLKEEFENSLKTELASMKKNWSDKQQSLKNSQKELEVKFNQALGQGVRPGPELWPSAH